MLSSLRSGPRVAVGDHDHPRDCAVADGDVSGDDQRVGETGLVARETYLVGPLETPAKDDWVTEVGWPAFRTGPQAG